VHAALAAGHGLSFHVAAALLALAAAAVTLVPGRAAALGAGVLLAGLLAAYALEHGAQLDAVAAFTKAIEALGLLLAARLAVAPRAQRPARVVTLVAAASIAVLAAAATPAPAHEHPPGAPAHGH